MNGLNLRYEQVPLRKESPDVQLVYSCPLAQDTTGQVDSRQRQTGKLRGRDIDPPTPGLNLNDAANDEVADFWYVARAEGSDGEELVRLEDRASDRGYDLSAAVRDVGTVTSVAVPLAYAQK